MNSINADKSQSVSRNEALIVIGVAAVWLVIITNPSKFFVGLDIRPIYALAEFLGMLIVPCLPTYYLAKYIAKRKNTSLYITWLICAAIVLSLQTIGAIRIALAPAKQSAAQNALSAGDIVAEFKRFLASQDEATPNGNGVDKYDYDPLFSPSARSVTAQRKAEEARQMTQVAAAEHQRLNAAIAELEIRHPELNPNSPRYNQRLVDEVNMRADGYVAQGLPRPDALHLAVSDLIRKPKPVEQVQTHGSFYQQHSTPSTRDCVFRAVMSNDDLKACGVRH